MQYDLAIIGAGVMAEAIARGLLKAGIYTPDRLIAADIASERRTLFQNDLKIQAVEDGRAAVADAAVVLLCVKPYQVIEAAKALGQAMADPLVISIAPGITSQAIELALGTQKHWRVIRAMPNTPMLVGEGMVAICAGTYATADDLGAAEKIFGAAARVLRTTEDRMDAVTAVSGSGPAYIFFLVEQMIQAGKDLGFSAADARLLAVQTALGAARMLAQTEESPEELRRRVTTPNGTTHAAITHMESWQWPNITQQAIAAAARRSRELGQ